MNITDPLIQHANTRGDHPAVEDGDEIVSYAEFLVRVDGAVANLANAGVRRDDFVATLLQDSVNHLVLICALAKLGAINIPIDMFLPRPEISRHTRGLNIRAVVTDGEADVVGVESLNLNQVCELRPQSSTVTPVAETPFDGRHPVLVTQSSGSTGTPKRLILSHEQIWSRSIRQVGAMGLTAADRYLQNPNLTYITGRRRGLAMLHIGGTVVIDRTRQTGELPALLTERNITFLYLAPGRAKDMLSIADEQGLASPAFPNLKIVLSGSPITHDLRRRVRESLTPQTLESYATNEVGDLAVATPADQDEAPDSIGRLMEDVEAEVVDQNDQPLPLGRRGVIRFRGPHFPRSYLLDNEATARGFRHGWFYPGDIAAIDDLGFVYFEGRADEAINSSGDKYYPAEVESVLAAHPAVFECAVTGRYYNRHTEAAVAFVVSSGEITLKELIRHCEARLASFKVPQHIEFVRHLPRNHTGKVRKNVLREDFQRKYRLTGKKVRWVGIGSSAVGNGAGER